MTHNKKCKEIILVFLDATEEIYVKFPSGVDVHVREGLFEVQITEYCNLKNKPIRLHHFNKKGELREVRIEKEA